MATLLHKYEDGEYQTAWFEAIDVSNNINHGGWFTSKEGAMPPPEVKDVKTPVEIEVIEKPEIESILDVYQEVEDETTLELKNLDLDTFENDDIRELARAAGIERYNTKRIATLKREIETIRNGD